jgi:phosphoglycerate dehydrogenase-like enzyme
LEHEPRVDEAVALDEAVLLLALARQIPSSDRSTKTGEWNRKGFIGVASGEAEPARRFPGSIAAGQNLRSSPGR